MNVEKHKHDFGKRIVDYAELVWFALFLFVCGITIWMRDPSALIAFIYSSAAVFGIVFGFSIWKAKSIYKEEVAEKYKIPVTNISDIAEDENEGLGDEFSVGGSGIYDSEMPVG